LLDSKTNRPVIRGEPFPNAVQLKTDLSTYPCTEYAPGGTALIRFLWYFTNVLFFMNPLNPVSSLKVVLLRWFGATVGEGVVIKPSVNIKYPWRLHIGNHVWIGEKAWIDNLGDVFIADHCVLSQGAMLLSGSHDFSRCTFNVQIDKIVLEEGVWIGARAIVYMGATCKSHCILGANSIALKDMDSYAIYYGNPAVKISERVIHA
jgi:putative colanic acid biosynthesis acetyltransferase WcaF